VPAGLRPAPQNAVDGDDQGDAVRVQPRLAVALYVAADGLGDLGRSALDPDLALQGQPAAPVHLAHGRSPTRRLRERRGLISSSGSDRPLAFGVAHLLRSAVGDHPYESRVVVPGEPHRHHVRAAVGP